MGVVTYILFLSPLPLLNNTSTDFQSQAFYPKKKGDFFYLSNKKIDGWVILRDENLTFSCGAGEGPFNDLFAQIHPVK